MLQQVRLTGQFESVLVLTSHEQQMRLTHSKQSLCERGEHAGRFALISIWLHAVQCVAFVSAACY